MKRAYDFSDVLIVPRTSDLESRRNVNLLRRFKFRYSPYELEMVPIMAANMDTVGTIKVAKTLSKYNLFTCLHKFVTLEEIEQEREFLTRNQDLFAFSIGCSEKEIQKLKDTAKIVDFKVICIDVANGHMKSFVKFCASVREQFPEKVIIAGNVGTQVGVMNLVEQGKVDIVKCGIGSGSACTTRIKTGVGIPQFTCTKECAIKAKMLGAHVISDGGITCPGDLGKAFGVGADFVMMGGQFAGHDQNPGEMIIEQDGKRYKEFYGMSSEHAMYKNYGGKSDYRSSEGRYIKIPYKGDMNETVEDFLGGLRSTCTYVNAESIDELSVNVTFIEVTNQFNRSLIN